MSKASFLLSLLVFELVIERDMKDEAKVGVCGFIIITATITTTSNNNILEAMFSETYLLNENALDAHSNFCPFSHSPFLFPDFLLSSIANVKLSFTASQSSTNPVTRRD